MPGSRSGKQDNRKIAEARKRARRAVGPQATANVDALIHELEVHKIELEMQNEELRNTQENLELSLTRYEDLFDLAPVGYLILSPNGTITDANLTIASLLSTDRSRLKHANLNWFVSPEYQDSWQRHLRATFRNKDCQTCELELSREDGSHLFVQLESIAQHMGANRKTQCLTVATDISERRRQEALIQRQANYDALTDLPNRTLLWDRLAYTIRMAHRERGILGLFFIDVDNFKWINDTYGHPAGDQVLIEIARRLVNCARENDTVARLSGDEFCMLLPRISGISAASLVANKVLAAMEEPFVLPDDTRLDVGCSIGIAMYPKDGDHADALLKSADIALYQVKQSGRRHFAFFSKVDEESIQRRQKLSAGLKKATIKNELTLRYQPVIELATGKPFGAEALVRWQHPEQGLLLPGEFIPVAETTGTIVEVGEWVMKNAMKHIHHWCEENLGLSAIWVNLSARQCGTLERAKRFVTLLDELNDCAGLLRLGLEITESDVLELSESTARMFEHLHKQGIFLSVDDFGTGYSSLGRLLHLPIDFIKIDKSFVANILSSEKT
ncbi:MAG: putative bifunctional diguanylate cyclase/phosphodiesterase, partial [Gammaproteobacteria bacterium]